MEAKKAAAERAAEFVRDGMTVGLGTGSTAYWAIQKIGAKVREGLRVRAIATSQETENLARRQGIPLVTFAETDGIDLTIDGADEVDPDWNLIKGGGGALLREKIVAAASRQLLVVVDGSKRVKRLGRFPLPVEVVRFGFETVERKLRSLGCEPQLRQRGSKPFVTDNGHYILDCRFPAIGDPRALHDRINLMPGVVDNGLFIGMATGVIVGYENGAAEELAGPGAEGR